MEELHKRVDPKIKRKRLLAMLRLEPQENIETLKPTPFCQRPFARALLGGWARLGRWAGTHSKVFKFDQIIDFQRLQREGILR